MEWKKLLNQQRINSRDSSSIRSTKDHRTEFERDYDRCLFSTPVRRLQDKAQVFPLEPHDSVRTRLTHSLEVSNIARGIANRVAELLINGDKIRPEDKESIIFIASTCALIHDLGNPPFGHAGEDAMRDWFRSKLEQEQLELSDLQRKDFLNFEGNAQTIRLVSKLQMLGDFTGLNLTAGTLAASRKYLSPSDSIQEKGNQAFKKLGYFQSERGLILQLEKETGAVNMRHPITYIVEAADDVVYSIIDIEDALKKGILDWDTIKSELLPYCKDLIEKSEENIRDRAERQNFTKNGTLKEGEFDQLRGQALAEARMSIFRTAVINFNMDSVVQEFGDRYNEIMNGTYERELVDNKTCGDLVKKCKSLAAAHVFPYPEILKLEIMGKNIIHNLMDSFWNGIKYFPYDELEANVKKTKKYPFNYKAYSLLSENYKTVFEAAYSKAGDNSEKNYAKLQFLADYICGMTDSFAQELHKKLKNG